MDENTQNYLRKKYGIEKAARLIDDIRSGKAVRVAQSHQCRACCLKHLATSLVIAGEIKTGYDRPEYHIYLLGNLSEAQEQVALIDNAFANRIRSLRMELFGDGGTAQLTNERLDRLTALAMEVRAALNADAGTATEQNSPSATIGNSGCGCRKKKISG